MSDILKCYTCGFQKDYEEKLVETPIYKRNGTLKEVRKTYECVDKLSPDFIRIYPTIGDSINTIVFKRESEYNSYYDKDYDEIRLMVCPKCGTIKLDKREG